MSGDRHESKLAIPRRSALKSGLAAAAGLTLPAALRTEAPTTTASPRFVALAEVMPTLAQYMHDAQARALPANAAEQTKLHLLDTIAAMVSGTQLAPGKAALAFARMYGGAPVAGVVGTTQTIGAIDAALVNAMLAHADETDDSHAPSESHPGCSIVPAALAAGEHFTATGASVLNAVALGYDVGTRVNMCLGPANFEVGNHQSSHAMAATWGSAAAASCVARLGAQEIPWLLAYAADQSSGLTVWQRDTDHIQKAFAFAGVGARNGVSAALMVVAGWTGVNDVLSGPYNFLAAYSSHADPAKLVDGLGQLYEVTRTNIKKWSVGSPIQAPLDALQNIAKRHPLEPEHIRGVTVRVATEEANLVDNREMPDICMQHMVAIMLVDKTVTFRSAHDKPRMQDPTVLAQRAKVKLVRDESLEHLLPKRVAIVDVALDDGTTLTERVDAVRGTAQNPMTREEVLLKATDLMEPVLGTRRTSRLTQTVMEIENLKNVRELRPLLSRG